MKRPLEDQGDMYERNPIVFLDISIGEEKVGRVVIELFKKELPRTTDNFRALCTGEKGIGTFGKKLHYKGTIFHKVLSYCMIQGGDIVNFDGTSGESIYGPHFQDESFQFMHDGPGLVSMVNEGQPNTNSSQFIITLDSCPHLDHKNVVFGKVIKGMGIINEVAKSIKTKDMPEEKIWINDCGELKRGENWGLIENDGSEDVYTAWPEDWDHASYIDKLTYQQAVDIVSKIKDSGNRYFKEKNYVDAGRKYKKALRYYDWMTKLEDASEEMNKTTVNLKVTIQLNLATVRLKQGSFRETYKICDEILRLDRTNTKALFRRGQALIGLNDYDHGLADLEKANVECPNNKDIIEELQKVRKIIKSYLVYEKATCRKMFA